MLFTYDGVTKSITTSSIKGGWSINELEIIANKHQTRCFKKNRKKTCMSIVEVANVDNPGIAMLFDEDNVEIKNKIEDKVKLKNKIKNENKNKNKNKNENKKVKNENKNEIKEVESEKVESENVESENVENENVKNENVKNENVKNENVENEKVENEIEKNENEKVENEIEKNENEDEIEEVENKEVENEIEKNENEDEIKEVENENENGIEEVENENEIEEVENKEVENEIEKNENENEIEEVDNKEVENEIEKNENEDEIEEVENKEVENEIEKNENEDEIEEVENENEIEEVENENEDKFEKVENEKVEMKDEVEEIEMEVEEVEMEDENKEVEVEVENEKVEMEVEDEKIEMEVEEIEMENEVDEVEMENEVEVEEVEFEDNDLKKLKIEIKKMKDIIVIPDHDNENTTSSVINLIKIPNPRNVSNCKIEHFIDSSFDTLGITGKEIPYLNMGSCSISDEVDNRTVIKSFMDLPTEPLRTKKVYICQISQDQLTPHLPEMCHFLSSITGMDVVLMNPMILQIQNNSPVLLYKNVKFNVKIEEFTDGFSLLTDDIEDIMNIALLGKKSDINSVVFISSHMLHSLSKTKSNKEKNIYRFISTSNEYDSLGAIVFNICMKILIKVIKSMDIPNCSVYRCIMNKKDTTDTICPLCRYSIHKRTTKTLLETSRNVRKLYLTNTGLNAMRIKYNKF